MKLLVTFPRRLSEMLIPLACSLESYGVRMNDLYNSTVSLYSICLWYYYKIKDVLRFNFKVLSELVKLCVSTTNYLGNIRLILYIMPQFCKSTAVSFCKHLCDVVLIYSITLSKIGTQTLSLKGISWGEIWFAILQSLHTQSILNVTLKLISSTNSLLAESLLTLFHLHTTSCSQIIHVSQEMMIY